MTTAIELLQRLLFDVQFRSFQAFRGRCKCASASYFGIATPPEANTQLPMKEVDLGTIVSSYEIIQSKFRCETTDV
jgi:hypothetical protein